MTTRDKTMIILDENGVGYFKGQKVKKTDIMDSTTYSFTLVAFELLDGPHKGEHIWQPID